MIDPASGPFHFDTSADSYFDRTSRRADRDWLAAYVVIFPVRVSVITLIERLRGYALLLAQVEPSRRGLVAAAREAYLEDLERAVTVSVPLTKHAGIIAAELMALCPTPSSPPRRSHRFAESRQERLSRWRSDILIAATALSLDMLLIHNNPEDFEFLRAAIERSPERFPGVGPLNLISIKRLAA